MNPALNPERVTFVKALAEVAPLTVVQGLFSSFYPESQIVLNQTVCDDLNFRVFEALGAGALLLTEASRNGLEELFIPGQDLVTYRRGDVREAASLINHFLQNPVQAQTIAARGELKVQHYHQSHHRAESILQYIQNTAMEDPLRQITERLHNPLRPQGELLQLLVCALSFTFLEREHAREALDKSLSLMQRCLSPTPKAPFSKTLTRLSCLATFAFDFLFHSSSGAKVRATLLEKAPQNPYTISDDEEETMPVPTDMASTRAIINYEISKLRQIKPAENSP
jgi:hypothetical protein